MNPKLVCVQTSVYSGATLTARLMGAHPEIATVGELEGIGKHIEDVDTFLCSCGQKMKECEFWQSVRRSIKNRKVFDTSFNLESYPRLIRLLRSYSSGIKILDSIRDAAFWAWPKENERLNQLIMRNETLIDTILRITNSNVFVDTSKDGLGRLRAMQKSQKFDVRAIHLVRDVRGVVASRLRRGDSDDVRWLAKRWVRWNQNRWRALRTLPEENHILVRYEDLCLNLRDTLEKIFRFCEVDPCFRIAEHLSTPLHILGNSMRLRPISEICIDERWKSSLTKDQLAQISKVAGSFGRQVGYF